MIKKITLYILAVVAAAPVYAQQNPKAGKVKIKIETKATATEPALQVNKVTNLVTEKAAPAFAGTITAQDLKKHLSILASDAYEGRETGEKGQKMAAEYIATFFKENGLTPPPGLNSKTNPYYQTFELERKSWGNVFMKVGNQQFTFLKDFYSLGADIPKEETLQVVFAGYGIEEGTHDDYKQLDVKGKAVVIFSGEPTDGQGKSLITNSEKPSMWATDWRNKQRLATKKGARAVIFISEGSSADFAKTIERLHHWIDQPTMGLPGEAPKQARAAAFFVSPELGAELLATSTTKIDKFKAQQKKKGKLIIPPFKATAAPFILKAERKTERFTTENVLGYIEGSDLKEEVLIVTAHYDHIGIKDGKVYNGADDDGSGTVAVLELAQAFAEAKKAGAGPRRSMLFMPVTGEEKGLLGSAYYTTNPVLPLSQTVADLNIDMIGRTDEKYKDDKNYVYVIGSDKLSTDLHNINENANNQYTKLKLDYTYNDPNDPNQFYYRSDHYNFAKNNIPIIFYFNGTHPDYHQETDEVEKILFDKIESISKLVFYTAWDIANRNQRPVVDKTPAENRRETK